MKRIFAMILSAVMLLTMVSCGRTRRTGATLEIDLSRSYASVPISEYSQGIRLYPERSTPIGLAMEFYYPRSGKSDLYLYDPADPAVRQVMKQDEYSPVWVGQLPDGHAAAIFNIAVGRQNGANLYDDKSRKIEIYDDDLNLLEERPLPDEMPKSRLLGHNLAMDQNGNWLLFAYDNETMFTGVFILNPDFSVKQELDWEYYGADSIYTGTSGALYTACGMPDSSGRQLFRFDLESCSYEQVEDWSFADINGIMDGVPGSEFELYYTKYDGIYGFRADGTTALVVDFWNSDFPDSVWGGYTLPDNTFVINYWAEGDHSGDGYFRLLPRTEEETANVQFISLAGVNINHKLVQEACKYNQSQTDYRIVIKDYGREMLENSTDPDVLYEKEQAALEWRDYQGPYTEAVTAFKNDLLGGTVPDIICLEGMPYQQLSNKGLLTDLQPMLDEDERFQPEDYFMNIFDGLKKGDRLERIGFSYIVDTMAAKTDLVGTQQGRSPAEYLQMLRDTPEDMRYLVVNSRERAADLFLMRSQSAFIDKGAMTCSFDSESFIGLLELTASLPPEDQLYSNDEEYWQMWADGYLYSENHVLLDDVEIRMPIYYHDVHYEQFRREDITLVGYPETSGGNGGMYRMNYTIALTSQSDKVEPVWEFIMEELGKQKQSKVCTDSSWSGDTLPVMRFALDNCLHAATLGVRQNGTANEEEMNTLRAYIDGMRMYEENDPFISAIIYEEAQKYFSGDATAQQAAQSIQSRVSLYLSEQQ